MGSAETIRKRRDVMCTSWLPRVCALCSRKPLYIFAIKPCTLDAESGITKVARTCAVTCRHQFSTVFLREALNCRVGVGCSTTGLAQVWVYISNE